VTTYITFVLDETGSMGNIKDETISGFNKYIETLKEELKGRTSFSLLKFDSVKLDWFVKNASVKKVAPLSEDTYMPGAMTPLWDAVAHAIKETEERLKGKKDPTVIFTVLTDGYENASREFNAAQVREMIEGHDDWAFNFVGAGIDAWALAETAGFVTGSISYTSPYQIGTAMKGISRRSAVYASANKVEQSAMRSDFYGGKTDIGKDDDSS